MQIKIIGEIKEKTTFSHELLHLSSFAQDIPGGRVLCVNPRAGELPLAFRDIRSDLRFDAFVSDDEWVDAAKTFSGNVYFGYSHTPLASLPNSSYDAVLICEDMGFVDDCDAMLCEYYRLLKQGGMLIGGIWNMSYHRYLISMLQGVPLLTEKFSDGLHGCGSIPIGTLLLRLEGLSFSYGELFLICGEDVDVSRFMEVGDSPADETLFLAKTFLIKGVK